MDSLTPAISLMDLPSELIRAAVDMVDPIDRTVLSYVCKSFTEMVRGRGICPDIACDTAAAAGNLDLLKWMMANGYTPDMRDIDYLAMRHEIEIIDWMNTM